jgi:putative endonuclease
VSPRQYCVYIATNHSKTLYVGVTSDLQKRIAEHRSATTGGFTSRYRIDSLVYFESTTDIFSAIAREKQIKGWSREKKLRLVESKNPGWVDLVAG